MLDQNIKALFAFNQIESGVLVDLLATLRVIRDKPIY